jgi:hypothetical protein
MPKPMFQQMEVDAMKYVLLIYQPKDFDSKALSESEYKRVAAEYAAVTAMPNVKPGLPTGLPKDAVTVRVQNGETVTAPGTYQDHAVGGYLEFDADTLDAAIELAARIPAARLGGAIEVRPAQRYW